MNAPPEWETHYRNLAPAGLRYAYAILRDKADAEEVIQDAFCQLLASPKWGRAKMQTNAFGAVLFTTIRRRAIDVLRQRTRANVHLSLVPPRFESDASRLEQDESEQAIHELIDQLPSPWGDALRMRIIGGRSYGEIGKALNGTPAQVRTWLYRARRQLADELRQRGVLRETGSTNE